MLNTESLVVVVVVVLMAGGHSQAMWVPEIESSALVFYIWVTFTNLTVAWVNFQLQSILKP